MASKILLAATAALGLSAASVSAEETRILNLAPNCTATLSQDINGKLMDIVTCPEKESLDPSIRIMPSETTTYGDFTQQVGYMIAPDLPIGQEITVSLKGLSPFIIGKTIDAEGPYYYSIAGGYTQLVPTEGFDCFRSIDSLTNSEIMVCDNGERIPEDFIKTKFGESGKVVFLNGHEVPFDDIGTLGIKAKNEIPL